jgi:hypothetical protein
MTVKQFFSKARQKFSGGGYDAGTELDGLGFVSDGFESSVGLMEPEVYEDSVDQSDGFEQIVVDNDRSLNRDSSEVVTEAFEKLVDQLQGINGNLNRQINQHEELMSKIENIPEILGALPVESENQRRTISVMVDQLKQQDARQQQMVETLRDIPLESNRQTNTLIEMNHKLSAGVDADVQLAEGINKFNKTLGGLNTSTLEQSEAIEQMSKTFATSDRYLKHVIAKQNKRFAWIFITAMSVCTFAIITVVVVLAIALKG